MIFMSVVLIPFLIATWLIYKNMWKLWTISKGRRHDDEAYWEEVGFTVVGAIVCTAIVGGLLQGIFG